MLLAKTHTLINREFRGIRVFKVLRDRNPKFPKPPIIPIIPKNLTPLPPNKKIFLLILRYGDNY